MATNRDQMDEQRRKEDACYDSKPPKNATQKAKITRQKPPTKSCCTTARHLKQGKQDRTRTSPKKIQNIKNHKAKIKQVGCVQPDNNLKAAPTTPEALNTTQHSMKHNKNCPPRLHHPQENRVTQNYTHQGRPPDPHKSGLGVIVGTRTK
eukprot:14311621-Ditylum_brightwellii.AAC.1